MYNESKRKSNHSRTSYIIALALVITFIAAIYVHSVIVAHTKSSIPYIPNINETTVSTVIGSNNYSLQSSGEYQSHFNSNALVAQSYKVFLYNKYSNSTLLPASISSVVMLYKNNTAAKLAINSIIYGGIPASEANFSRLYNKTVMRQLKNLTNSTVIVGHNIKFYTILLNTSFAALPLYNHTAISPPVFECETIFNYGNYTGVVTSTSYIPLKQCIAININISKSLAKTMILKNI